MKFIDFFAGVGGFRRGMGMWIFGCRSCGSITMVNRQPFDDWHECPVCRQMVHLNSLPSKEFEIVDTGETWQEQIKRAAEEGNSWQ